MNQRESLLYDLIFSEKNEFIINIADHIEDIYNYDIFIDEVKLILKKSKVMIIKEKIEVDSDQIIWNLKLKK